LRHLASRARAAKNACEQVKSALPRDLAARVTHVAERSQELTIWIDSAAFCARLRFEAPRLRAALATSLGTPLTRIRVKVQPRSAASK
jgi:hypothetical protein